MRNLMKMARGKLTALNLAVLAFLVPMAAMAQTAAPDTSAITAEFDTYKVAVVALVIAFAVVLWAIRAAGLLKPR